MSELLFVYGTLRSGFDNAYARKLRASAQFVGPAAVRGTVVDLGQYPGFRPGPAGEVVGELWRLDLASDILAVLDEYEGSEYTRVVVQTIGGRPRLDLSNGMRYSSRLPHGAPLNRMAELLAAKRRDGVEILDLTESNPTHAGIEYPWIFLAALSDERALRYEPEAFGMPAARELIAAEYGVPFDRVVLTASTSEAYSWLFKLLCDPGDEVLVPRPSYPLFDYLAALESVAVRHYGLFYDHGWFIDFHTIERAIHGKTRALVLVNPNNPTGHFIRQRELDELRTICSRHDIAIISDEVFADYAIQPAADSVLTLRGIADFVLNGLSKTVGLPQMKLGWIIAKDSPERLEMIADTYLSVGTPVQCALPALLALREPVQRQIMGRVRQNLALLERALIVDGGWYAVLPVMDEEETAERLLSERNVLVQPGYFYDFEKPGYLVLSLLTPPDVFRRGVDELKLH